MPAQAGIQKKGSGYPFVLFRHGREPTMKFYEIVEQALMLLQRQGRVSYRELKREFDLDDEYLEDLKAEIIEVKRLAVDENGKMLVWVGAAGERGAKSVEHE